jgi:hypothetical protein
MMRLNHKIICFVLSTSLFLACGEDDGVDGGQSDGGATVSDVTEDTGGDLPSVTVQGGHMDWIEGCGTTMSASFDLDVAAGEEPVASVELEQVELAGLDTVASEFELTADSQALLPIEAGQTQTLTFSGDSSEQDVLACPFDSDGSTEFSVTVEVRIDEVTREAEGSMRGACGADEPPEGGCS